MRYEGEIYRPPSEAKSLILQLTIGCSHNRCTFCPSYKGKRFRIRSFEEVKTDIDEVAPRLAPYVRRVFLADGDALIVKQELLLQVLDYLDEKFPLLERVGIYANAKGVLRKSPEELKELRRRKLGIVYLGIESGDQVVLDRVKKGTTREKLVEACLRVKDAGMKLSVTVLLGIGGRERSKEHAVATGEILTEVDPHYAGALTLLLVPGTPLYEEYLRGEFQMPSPFELLEELHLMLSHTDMHGLFTSNHASNYLPLKVKMPEEKEEALRAIEAVLRRRDPNLLRPEWYRAL